MNPHPFFVHFPIALLTVYALLEIISFYSSNISEKTKGLKAFLVIIGSLAIYPTLFTGEIAEENILSVDSPTSLKNLIETHSSFATASAVIFSIVALSYIWILIRGRFSESLTQSFLGKFLTFLNNQYISSLLSLIGIIALTITGALGGAIVYGPNVDPFVSFVYGFLF